MSCSTRLAAGGGPMMMVMLRLMLDLVELPQFLAAEMQMRPDGHQGGFADFAFETMQFLETPLPILRDERHRLPRFPGHLESIEAQHQFRMQANVGKGVGDYGLVEVARKIKNESAAFLVLKLPALDVLEQMLVRLIVREQPLVDFVLALGEHQQERRQQHQERARP